MSELMNESLEEMINEQVESPEDNNNDDDNLIVDLDSNDINCNVESKGELEMNDHPPEDDNVEEKVVSEKNTFEERAESMGLENVGNGCFRYIDDYTDIVYRTLHTKGDTGYADEIQIPDISIFTRKANTEDKFLYCGNISNSYTFLGNNNLLNNIHSSIKEIGQSILNQKVQVSNNNTVVRSDIIIQHSNNVSEIGDIYPQITIINSYNGSYACTIAFGLYINGGGIERSCSFTNNDKLGTIRKIHHLGSKTSMSTEISGYVDIFSNNIHDVISQSFEQKIDEDEMLKILDSIEGTGKKRRVQISEYLKEIGDNEPMNAWKMFLAITRFSTIEKNINIKKVFESAAERVLVIPHQMIEAVKLLKEKK